MAVLPIAQLFFPCAHLERDDDRNTVTLVDPIDSIYLPDDVEKNFALGPIFFYALVKAGLGTFFFRIEVRDDRGRRFAKSRPTEIHFSAKNHNVAEELFFKFRDLRIGRPGVIQFDLFANEVAVASWELALIRLGE